MIPIATDRPLGVIPSGGEGRRFGEPKAAARLPSGPPFAARVRAALAAGCGEAIVAVGRPLPVDGVETVPDRRPDTGPLGALETGLAVAVQRGHPGIAVLAVDLPRASGPVVLELLARWRGLDDPSAGVVIAEDSAGPQPLAGVWGGELLPGLTRWLDGAPGDGLAVHRFLDDLRSRGVRVETVGADRLVEVAGHGSPLLNVNRPGDLEAALAPLAPVVIGVAGWKDAGKTTVAEALVAALRDRGHRVMALKRGHGFDLDREGTDSARLAAAGAERVGLAGPEGMALLGSWPDGWDEGPTLLARRWMPEAEVVVAEGWKSAPIPIVEVRSASGPDRPPLWTPAAADRDRVRAVVPRSGAAPDFAAAADPAGAPPRISAEDPALGERLADLLGPLLPGGGA